MTTTEVRTTQVFRVYIKASAQAVWDAITKPEWTNRYGYGGRLESDLQPGHPYRWTTSDEMRAAGAEKGYQVPEVAIDGEILEADPPRKLVMTWRMVMDPGLAAEGFTRLTYEIDEAPNGVTRLTVAHELENAPKLAVVLAGDREAEGAGGGWSWVLSGLKTLLETGQEMPR
jgi:uncharacterized protein YndB with AHSA1/START domain